jgi:hypothetical protein
MYLLPLGATIERRRRGEVNYDYFTTTKKVYYTIDELHWGRHDRCIVEINDPYYTHLRIYRRAVVRIPADTMEE